MATGGQPSGVMSKPKRGDHLGDEAVEAIGNTSKRTKATRAPAHGARETVYG